MTKKSLAAAKVAREAEACSEKASQIASAALKRRMATAAAAKPAAKAAISGTATAAQIKILEAEIPIAIKAEIQKRKDNKDMNMSHHNTHSRLYLHFKRIVKTHKMPYDLVKQYANKAVKKVRVTG